MAKNTSAAKKIFIVLLVLYLFIMVFPLIYLVSASFMTTEDLAAIPAKLFPSSLKLTNYITAFTRQPLVRYVLNSFITSFLSVFICLATGCMASYALVRTRIKGKTMFLLFVLAISLLPTITIINPIYRMYSSMKLLNTRIGLSIISAVLDLPMTIWFLTAAFKSIPVSFEESAEIEGAGLGTVLMKVYVPLLKGSIFSIGIIDFISAWNKYLLSQVLNPFEEARTVVVGLTLYQLEISIPFEIVSAASVITIIPLFVIVLLFQKNILGGLLDGGIKE